jgi:hypothetical protein
MLGRRPEDLDLAALLLDSERLHMVEELAPRHLVDRGCLHDTTQALATDSQIAQKPLSTRAFSTKW